MHNNNDDDNNSDHYMTTHTTTTTTTKATVPMTTTIDLDDDDNTPACKAATLHPLLLLFYSSLSSSSLLVASPSPRVWRVYHPHLSTPPPPPPSLLLLLRLYVRFVALLSIQFFCLHSAPSRKHPPESCAACANAAMSEEAGVKVEAAAKLAMAGLSLNSVRPGARRAGGRGRVANTASRLLSECTPSFFDRSDLN